MQHRALVTALIVSVLLNLGVVGAAGYRALVQDRSGANDLASRLELDAVQRTSWHSLEQDFVRELDAGWQEIARHREALVREVFSERPEPARIESARARIAEVQGQQQQRVIAQFLQEREILNAEQRRELVEVLLREEQAAPRERQLHGGK
ncbi:MAG: periplasmic heavy metal sensor [Rubrivivax sp.]|nr:periplasmic heavy metal sensor [Rubrivivax sp.]